VSGGPEDLEAQISPEELRVRIAQRVMVLAQRGWISLRQFADLADISYPTARKLRDEGKIDYVMVGDQCRIYAEEVERFLRHGNLPPPDATAPGI
jgi:excisionase family DNA binding protein